MNQDVFDLPWWGQPVPPQYRALVELDGHPTLILQAETGVFYSAQTHGLVCYHPVMEGFAVPITFEVPPHDLTDGGGCWGGVPEALADWIDDEGGGAFTVDRGRAQGTEWGEAWVPITTAGGYSGVLTYENCD